MRAYSINTVASGGGFHLRYDGTVGVTLSGKPQLLAVNLVRSNRPQALTGHFVVDMLPQSDLPSMEEHFVASGRPVLPLVRMADLELGDILGVTHAPLMRSAGPLAARHPNSRPFFWPTCGDPDLCRYGFTSRSCGSYGLALTCPARAFDPGTARFVPARPGTTTTSASDCI